MKILSVDTAFGNSSVCILVDGKVASLLTENKKEAQAERLFIIIQQALDEVKLTYNDIDIFAATLGPGSFTGIRIGLSGILAVAYALNKKFVGVTSLEAVAHNYVTSESIKDKNEVCVLLNANRSEAYLQCFNSSDPKNLKPLNEGELINLNEIEKYSAEYRNASFIYDNEIVGEKLKNITPALSYHFFSTTFSAQDIAEVAYNKMLNGTADHSKKSPVYIRKPDAKIPIKRILR